MTSNTVKRHFFVHGFVQGVGFRPFVYRIANELNLRGWVSNGDQGVEIEIEGPQERIQIFLQRLQNEKPSIASIETIQEVELSTRREALLEEQVGVRSFEIRASVANRNESGDIGPDLATCSNCLNEVLDPQNRRFEYPFTNCTYCGPRFTITNQLPYDRPSTTMREFLMCRECLAEYENPSDRRFHAQPIACPDCGPQLELRSNCNQIVFTRSRALNEAIQRLRGGAIVAMKGLGGYQLICDPYHAPSLQKLREKKHRPIKPFALMFKDIKQIEFFCDLNEDETRELQSPMRPIVLVKKKKGISRLLDEVAPENQFLGVFLPTTPLHYLLLDQMNQPLVVTSGNRSGEPMAYKDQEAIEQLKFVADIFLTHNRPIARPIDDSVVMFVKGKRIFLRVARGYAPLIWRRSNQDGEILALGAHTKGAFAFQKNQKIVASPYLGSLEYIESQNLYIQEIEEYKKFYSTMWNQMICDLHPDYFTTTCAHKHREGVKAPIAIQHHEAHVYSVLFENSVLSPALCVAWDGLGLGQNGLLCGGEFFIYDPNLKTLKAVGQLAPFRLLGGESGVRSPWKVALSLLFEVVPEQAESWFKLYAPEEVRPFFKAIYQSWRNGVNAPRCTSVGRFMDGVAALIGLKTLGTFEGEPAIRLEQLVHEHRGMCPDLSFLEDLSRHCDFELRVPKTSSNNLIHWDWRPWLNKQIEYIFRAQEKEGWDQSRIQLQVAQSLHLQLAAHLFDWANYFSYKNIVLSGGVFQNRLLLELILGEAEKRKMEVILPKRLPMNDGAIAIGQLFASTSYSQSENFSTI